MRGKFLKLSDLGLSHTLAQKVVGGAGDSECKLSVGGVMKYGVQSPCSCDTKTITCNKCGGYVEKSPPVMYYGIPCSAEAAKKNK